MSDLPNDSISAKETRLMVEEHFLDIEEKLNKRMQEFESNAFKESLQFQKLLDDHKASTEKRVRDEIDREVERVKLTVGTAWKVLGLAIVLIVGGAAAFSIKTAYDIHDGIEAATKAEVNRRLNSEAKDAPFHRVLTKAMVDAYLLSYLRGRADSSSAAPVLDDVTAGQLIESLKDPSTKDREFREVVRVLVATHHTDSWPKVSRALVNAIKASPPDFGWLSDEPERRVYLIRSLSKISANSRGAGWVPDVLAASRDIVQKSSNSTLIASAIHFVALHGDHEDLAALEKRNDTNDPDVRLRITEALARIDPSRKTFKDSVVALEGMKPSLTRSADAIIIVNALVAGPPSGIGRSYRSNPSNNQERTAPAIHLLSMVVKDGYPLAYMRDIGTDGSGDFGIGKEGGGVSGSQFDEFVLSRAGQVLPELISSGAMNDLDSLRKFAYFFTARTISFGEDEDQDKLAVSRLHLSLGDTTVVILETGERLTSKSTVNGIDLDPDPKELFALYRDARGSAVRSKITSVEGIAKSTVELHVRPSVRAQIALGSDNDGFDQE